MQGKVCTQLDFFLCPFSMIMKRKQEGSISCPWSNILKMCNTSYMQAHKGTYRLDLKPMEDNRSLSIDCNGHLIRFFAFIQPQLVCTHCNLLLQKCIEDAQISFLSMRGGATQGSFTVDLQMKGPLLPAILTSCATHIFAQGLVGLCAFGGTNQPEKGRKGQGCGPTQLLLRCLNVNHNKVHGSQCTPSSLCARRSHGQDGNS